MSNERVLCEAKFDSAVRYYVLSTGLVLALTIVGIPLALIILPIIWIVRTIEYKNIRMTLHERTLHVRRGVFNKVEKTIPLDKITDLAVIQGPIMRFCGVNAINIETAGGQSAGVGSALVNIVGVRDAKAFRDAVLEQRDRLVDGVATERPNLPASSDEMIGVLREIRDSLVRIENRLGQD
ncbi:MAG TPA: PH domain-containing protein [Phycisphaerales bacterium]|nr:PH domain-containing protein [Phycisphaerales bacterium]